MIKITSSLKGIKVVDKRIKQLRNKRKPLTQIANKEVDNARTRIRSTKKDPDGKAWAPMARSTRLQRQREGTIGRGLLYRGGNLLRSIKYSTFRDRLRIFSSAVYSKYLRKGTPKMPDREFLGWSKQSTKQVKQLFKKHWKR